MGRGAAVRQECGETLAHLIESHFSGDLTQTKLWAWVDDQLVRTLFTQLGANGVPLGVPDVLPSLQTGLINACYGSPLSTLALQWYTKVKYMTSMHISQAIGATVITKKEFDKLDPWIELVKLLERGTYDLTLDAESDSKEVSDVMIKELFNQGVKGAVSADKNRSPTPDTSLSCADASARVAAAGPVRPLRSRHSRIRSSGS